jgi:AraC-like DNA-binding protein
MPNGRRDFADPPAATPRPSAVTAHVDRVLKATLASAVESADPITTSWRRSAKAHGVDPSSKAAPRILSCGELNERREPLAKLIADAHEELDQLYAIVKDAKYTVLLCDDQGVAVDHRGNEIEAEDFKYWGTWLGGVWGEGIEGTNGIGTCIAEKRPITVHCNQHFRARHAALSCSGAPIFNPAGELVAVLDVSSIDPQLSEASHALTGPLTEMSARSIEERCFREGFRRDWIIAIAPAATFSPGMLLAVDSDHRVVGADRYARSLLARNGLRLEDGVDVWSLFKRNPDLLHKGDRGDFAAAITMTGASDTYTALVTPPEAAWRNMEMMKLHSRPRLHGIRGFLAAPLPTRSHGGLAPAALRRVKDFIDANLDKNLDLETLAETAELSTFHFARAFKKTTGTTPHNFLLERRVDRARQLLLGTDLSLAEIARAVGFSDQGHLARHVRTRLGVPPSILRRSAR